MKVFCDGGARGNPGPAASAFVVYDNAGKFVFEDSKYLGETTNNVAEYEALIMALSWAAENAQADIQILLDSELVKKQMTGEYKIKSPHLLELARKAKLIEQSIGFKVNYSHTMREGNAHADMLVNSVLDKASV